MLYNEFKNILTCLSTIKWSIRKTHSLLNSSQTASRRFLSCSGIAKVSPCLSLLAINSDQWTSWRNERNKWNLRTFVYHTNSYIFTIHITHFSSSTRYSSSTGISILGTFIVKWSLVHETIKLISLEPFQKDISVTWILCFVLRYLDFCSWV